MLDRLNPALRIVCLLLAALVLHQLSRTAFRKDPLDSLNLSANLIDFQTVGTNKARSAETQKPKTETNSAARAAVNKGANSGPVSRVPMPPKAAELPPQIQTRVDRITQSEILGAVVRPLPMALLGIAGKDAFVRTPNGQTGLLREGEELGGVKLLRIGTNRVLIEHEQQQKELTLFSGFGSESLLPKGKANSE